MEDNLQIMKGKFMDYITWEQAAEQAVQTIFDTVPEYPVYLSNLRTELDWVIDMWFNETVEGDISPSWIQIGGTAVRLSEQFNKLTVEEVAATLVRKQRDYGPDNIARFGRTGLIVRMHDKVARLENLLSTARNPSNESIVDNYLDVVGYAAIGLMWERDTFLSPFAS